MYQALYRKWRPRNFDEVSGQPHVTLTLQNELKSGRISHAYLFTGSRGTGKTSCAKILSKAVNCLNPQNGNPCGECELCRGIDEGSLLDVIEIDAASNNGVDNIRDIREEVNFTPVRCRYRVYIIDEVHMLSPGAFNALLKTLEEPPAHVIFILATTEINKLPATILSRCQRFDFKRISPEDISARLLTIAQGESIDLTDDAANLIARIADGGMRDAVSLLDRCCAHGTAVDADVVSAAAGIAGTEHLFRFSEMIAQNDFAGCIALVNRLHAEACDIESLCTELTLHFRNLMVAKTVKDCGPLIICPKAELEQLKERSARFKLSAILNCLDILEAAGKNMKNAVNKKIQMEAAVIKMCSFKAESEGGSIDNEVINNLVSRIDSLEQKLASAPLAAAASAPVSAPAAAVNPPKKTEAPVITAPSKQAEPIKQPEPVKQPEPAPVEEPEPFIPEQEPAPASSAPAEGSREFTAWPEVVDKLKALDMPLSVLLANTTAFVSKGTHLVIRTDNPLLFKFIQSESHSVALRKTVFAVTGEKLKLAVKDNEVKKNDPGNPLADLKNKINAFNNNNE